VKYLNPNAVIFIAFCTVVGLLFHHGLVGAAIGLGIVVIASFGDNDKLTPKH
jgi:hypothetical protein